MLLDLDAATLTVWVNGERKGVMVRPGMTHQTHWAGELVPVGGGPAVSVGRLAGPLRWVVDLPPNAPVAIAGPLPPPA